MAGQGELRREPSRGKEAARRHERGYNCAQAVACTYCSDFGVDEREAFRATEGFGLGMGSMLGTCGAISGACYLAGLASSDADTEHPSSKRETYALARQITERFAALNGGVACRELKGVGSARGPRRSCPGCISDACRIVEDVLLCGA